MRAVSPFDGTNIEGKDSTIVPLPQDHLDRMIADEAKLIKFLQRTFKARGSGETLSYADATALAEIATDRLRRGALPLLPCTLGRACAMMPVPPPHRRMVCVVACTLVL